MLPWHGCVLRPGAGSGWWGAWSAAHVPPPLPATQRSLGRVQPHRTHPWSPQQSPRLQRPGQSARRRRAHATPAPPQPSTHQPPGGTCTAAAKGQGEERCVTAAQLAPERRRASQFEHACFQQRRQAPSHCSFLLLGPPPTHPLERHQLVQGGEVAAVCIQTLDNDEPAVEGLPAAQDGKVAQ